MLDLRTACLHRARRDVAAVASVLGAADDKTVKRAVDAVRSVTGLEECSDTERLLAVVPPPDDPEVAARVEEIRNRIAKSAALVAAGNYKQGLAEAKAAAEASAEVEYVPLHAEAHFHLAVAATRLDDAELTKSAVEKAVCAGLASGEDRFAARASYHMLWTVSQDGAEPEEFERWRGLSRALVERAGDDTLQIDLWSNEANALRRLDRLDEAMATIEKALALAVERFGEDASQAARLRMNVAAIAWATGDFGRAAAASRKAHATWRREFGDDHPRTASALNNLALAALREGNYPEAEQTMRKVLVTRERVYGKKSREYADALSNVAVVLTSSGGLEEAIEINRELVTTYGELSGADSVDVGQVWANLASVLYEVGRQDEALTAIEKGIEILEAKLGKEHRFMPTAYAILGGIERELGELGASSRHLAHGLAVGEKTLGPDSPRHATILSEIALTELLRRRPKAALAAVERALRLAGDQPLEPKHLGDLYFAEAQALWDTGGDRARALARAHEALGHLEKGGATTKREAERVRAWLESHGLSD
jgi:serine/threonine-protein kinase